MSAKISINETSISIISHLGLDYICLTDMVKNLDNSHIIVGNWLRRKDTIEYLGIWEALNNENFKLIEFDEFRSAAGANRFTLSPKQWIERTNAIGFVSKSGKNGGTYAQKDIAFHFAMWLSPQLQLLVVKEFQRLKDEEQKKVNSEWDYRRFLTKVNYHLHTDAVKEVVIPKYHNLSREEESYIYANEAEFLNVALFGKTSKKWREDNPEAVLKNLNMRDLATIPQLTVLANLEHYNSILLKEGLTPGARLDKLKHAAVTQLQSLAKHHFSFPIESPNSITPANKFNATLKGLLAVPPPKKDKKL
jgi:KilA-N domain